jgi:hypothetical protein
VRADLMTKMCVIGAEGQSIAGSLLIKVGSCALPSAAAAGGVFGRAKHRHLFHSHFARFVSLPS